jgi:hypothetical protein
VTTIDPIENDIEAERGDDAQIEFPIVDADGNVLNVTGASWRFTVKSTLDDAIGAAIFQLTQPAVNGIDDTDAATGIIVVTLPHLYLETMAGEYVYDLEMTLGGKVTTFTRNARLFVPKDVSTPGSVTNPSLPGQTLPGWLALDGGQLGLKDRVTGMWWRLQIDNGAINWYGPSAVWPF